MAKKNFYAVRKGLVPGIYRTWDECRAQVSGVPGAEYKGFPTETEARAYMAGSAVPEGKASPGLPRPYAFVDGSYAPKTRVSGYGGFLVLPDGTERVLQGSETDPEWTSMRNVAGEIAGCLAAVALARKLGLRELHIYYDYLGIEQWATGGWKTNKACTEAYAAAMKSAMKEIRITFHKVAGHTGVPGNERADALAKQAVGLI